MIDKILLIGLLLVKNNVLNKQFYRLHMVRVIPVRASGQ
jgi:hypothetical protein